MPKQQVIEFYTANTAATHLGRQLYTSSPSALAELVANSYDAYAENIWIELNSKQIVIADDGVGLSLADIRSQYASIGQAKKDFEPPLGKPKRNPMGKKGIGKLAAFSLGDQYTVFTKTQKDEKWITFTLSYSQMVDESNAVKYETEASELNSLPEELSHHQLTSGFVVVINNLRRATTQATTKYLETQLTRRFSLRNSNVNVFVNTNKVDLSPADLLYEHVRALNYIGYSEEEVEELFPHATDRQLYRPSRNNSRTSIQDVERLKEKGVKAWLGVIDQPQRLTDLGMGNLLVYINGKVADEDLLKSRRSAQMGGRYITGEMTADFLNEQSEDPITSSRQGLDQSDPEVEKLVELAEAMQNRAIDQWNKLKESDARENLPDLVKKDKKYSTWENGLSTAQRSFNSKLLRLMGSFEDFENEDWMSDEEKVTFINSVTTLVESLELKEISHELPNGVSDERSVLTLVTKYLGNVARQDRWQMADAAAKRLNAIERLQTLVDKKSEVEKAFEECLFENPWLLNPFWNRSTKSEEEIRITKQHFTEIRNETSDEHKRGYIDIFVEIAEQDLPVVVELKRHDGKGHSSRSKITQSAITDQVNRYRKGLFNRLPATKRSGRTWANISAIFVAPTSAIQTDSEYYGVDPTEIEQLAAVGILVTTYEELLNNARSVYREFFNAQSQNKELPYFRFNVKDEESD
ncbi:hypothetical protein HMPREF3145_04725 [Corynebacterium sp. HMSC05C01]|uniref:ATP-binding protein n=1 Tax=Corynebacterium sp. HMSC05C01 TaxID=1581113 RepID=UPI0008A1BF12|nr:ATP-binding protein [Corynebacterium sp. HMSC05C01]OFT70617.1 hypothetical protein HMPREF3145_04725 [Corynebacterium sp. HMSC05C01]